MKKKIEDEYKRLSQREHILLRNDTYIGSNNVTPETMFVVDNLEDLSNIKITKKQVNYVPGFIKIFDEILTNASDHCQREGSGVTYIKVLVEDGKISVENDGNGIPVVIHPKEKIYVPELIFGHLLTGSNYDDTEERYGAGRNGYGAKLTNIFSTKFIIETADGKNKYKQVFQNNMSVIGKPTITPSDESFTKITYIPDLAKFNMTEIDNDTISIIYRRAVDIAAYNPNIRVSINRKTIHIKSLKDYMKMHLTEEDEFFYEKINDFWEIGVAKSSSDLFEQVSIVNGNNTYKGGTHVNRFSLQLSQALQETLTKGNKQLKIKWTDIKGKLFLFLVCRVPNPTFDTQTKENLTSPMSTDVLKGAELSQNFIKKIAKSEIVESILEYIALKEQQELAKLNKLKNKSSKIKINKLDDANKAGTNESEKCYLILTEGDCLHEDTLISVIRNNEILKLKIKDAKVDDLVITHKNNIKPIYGISTKIKKEVIIKTKMGNLNCSENHRWFIYNKELKTFEFKETKDLDKNKHQLVKNKLAYFNDFIEIEEINNKKHGKYTKEILIHNDKIVSTDDHKFCVFDMNDFEFKMIKCKDLDKDIHKLVNFSSFG